MIAPVWIKHDCNVIVFRKFLVDEQRNIKLKYFNMFTCYVHLIFVPAFQMKNIVEFL